MKVFPLTEGDEKRMPIYLTQNGAALSWTPESVRMRISRNGSFIVELDAEPETAEEWYYDWTAADYEQLPGGAIYDCRLVVVKPVGIAPGGPETVPTGGGLQIDIAKAI